jgi:KaiC/GvpD/RAD55 family RecA-like ATPase
VSSTTLRFRTPLPFDNPVSVPILTELVPDGVKPGTLFIVEFDPASQWLAIAATITAGYLRSGGCVGYVAQLRSPETVKENLLALGVDISAVTREGRLFMNDWYSATLAAGRLDGVAAGASVFEPIEGGVRVRSLKVADLSLEWLKLSKQGPQAWDVVETWPPGALNIGESMSQTLRFNEEKPYLEWLISRGHPNERKAKRVQLVGVVRGVHTEIFYNQLESTYDGVIDLRVMERDEEAKNFIRLRSLKGQQHDARWHEIQIKRNGEAALVT